MLIYIQSFNEKKCSTVVHNTLSRWVKAVKHESYWTFRISEN